MTDQVLLYSLLFVPFLGSCAAALLPTNARNAEAWLSGAVTLYVFIVALSFTGGTVEGNIIRAEAEWLPALGLNFVLRLDGLAYAFTVLIGGIGTLVVLYARYYMSPEDPVPRFFSFLLAFMGAMLGVILSGNLIQIVFFWELTSLFSFLLIGYWHHNAAARDGAREALTVTAAGGLCLFGGVLMIGHIVGSYDLDVVLASGNRIVSHDLYLPTLILVLLGAFTKSAQFPFHFWLPRAMTAPTPVSAFLHSATMVKAGVFLLIRLWPVLAGHEYWFWIVVPVGATTLLVGAALAMFQQDLKGLLAYSTISHLGLITLLVGLGSPLALVAAIFHTLNHATFKASLFMAAGIIDHEAGTRDIRKLSGLYRFMPITATLAMVAAAAMAGVPLLNGFLSKEMFFAEATEWHDGSWLDNALPYMATLAGVFSVAYSLRFIHQVFFGPEAKDLPRAPHEPPFWMLMPIAQLVLICVLVGAFPQAVVGRFLRSAAHAVLGSELPYFSLAVWHGLTPALWMSVIALVGGVLLYPLMLKYLAGGIEGAPLLHRLKDKRIFERVIVFVSWRWARALEAFMGTRRLQPQLRILIYLTLLAAVLPLYYAISSGQFDPTTVDMIGMGLSWESAPSFILIWVAGIMCALGAAYQAKFHRLAAIIMAGGAGLAVCMTFAWFSAPDLALTQLVVEIVTTILLLLGLRWLPQRVEGLAGSESPTALYRRVRDAIVALICGTGMAVLAYAIMIRPQGYTVAQDYLGQAYTEGGGRNVVNVILVDFRAFDTMGEITVVGIAAIVVYSLLRRFRPAQDGLDLPQPQGPMLADVPQLVVQQGEIPDYMAVAALIMRLLFPVIFTMAVFLFLRGHDQPGGGFVAAITLSLAFLLQYMVGGARWAEARMRVLPIRWMGAGLVIAVLTGMASWIFGYPFMTSAFAYLDIPVLGKVPAASAMGFDTGVLALVLGATILIQIALAHQSIRIARAVAARAEREAEAAAAEAEAAGIAPAGGNA